ncbi:MAG TPA: hypothetical protein VFC13_03825 [Actinomycetes bacterium]|jgi:hypothetical protein|nr:hypothetical protein [Actinomycetes bacterium]
MTSDPNHVNDDEIRTVRGEEQADAEAKAEAALSGAGDTGVMMDAADSGTLDRTDVIAPSGASDTGVMMDAADSGALDRTDVIAPSGAGDTGAMMDSRDTGTIDRTDVGELGDADADEPDR